MKKTAGRVNEVSSWVASLTSDDLTKWPRPASVLDKADKIDKVDPEGRTRLTLLTRLTLAGRGILLTYEKHHTSTL
jgi:hypothetical protein